MLLGDAREIGKNTAFLYFRAAVTAMAGLFATRIVLRELGDTGYGMYCAVAGVTAVVFFVEGALFQTARRFLSCALSDGEDKDASGAFAAAMGLALSVCAALAIIGETAGRWFVFTRLSLPQGSAGSVSLLVHLFIAANVMRLLTTPFEARVFASERMGYFWKVSLVEAFALVAAALAVTAVPSGKAEAYAAFCLLVAVLRLSIGALYCKRKYGDVRFCPCVDFGRLRSQFGFFFWSVFYDLANILKYSAAGLLVNIYAGVEYSASWSVSRRVGVLMCEIALNFHNACFPGAVKLWASDHTDRYRAFTGWSFRLSAAIALVAAIPLLVFTERILGFWLGGELPPEAIMFTRCMVVHYLFDALAGPLTTAIVATGRIARYQFWMVTFAAAGFFLAWAVLACGLPAWIGVAAVALMNMMAFVYRFHYVVRDLGFVAADFVSFKQCKQAKGWFEGEKQEM